MWDQRDERSADQLTWLVLSPEAKILLRQPKAARFSDGPILRPQRCKDAGIQIWMKSDNDEEC